MATLDEIIDEQNKIHEELERMASDESTTEEADGGIRDTLVARWKGLDADREKIVARMEELNLIRKASARTTPAASPATAAAGTRGAAASGPEFMARRRPARRPGGVARLRVPDPLRRDRPRVHPGRAA